MFTGLIEAVGRVADVATAPAGVKLRIATLLAADLQPGESVAVNGVCLTVTAAGGAMHADIGPETARVTTLGSLRGEEPVNLERSMRADSRFGGHFVQGHVDAVGQIENVRQEGDAHWLTVRYPDLMAPYLVPKGSIAVDGISLTVAALRDGTFDVMIIPFTWEHTNLSARRVGDRVNLEGDMLGKYVARALVLRAIG
ncbi:MAG TPA: riboflavin synthase [Vicinamibacterales bacterium]|jgi:riboflavin synthase alpha subunit|nr:riboflavin synthase [Vicinamibacterales bacterium]